MKTMVITGASGGIGSEIVRAFAGSEWTVIAIDVRQPAEELSDVVTLQCDLSDGKDVARLLKEVQDKYSTIHVLINCAAAQNIGAVNTLDQDQWDQTFAVNVRAPWLLLKGLYPLLSSGAQEVGYASVINISSIHAVATSPGMVAYASSKAALGALTRSASIEYARDGIRVNSIVPGAVATPMLFEHLSSAKMEKLLSRQLIPELIDPMAIVGAVEYLISPAATNMTGQELTIDSGVLPQLSTEMA